MRLLVLLFSCFPLFAETPKLDSSVFGGIQARAVGPATMSGRITDIDVNLSDVNEIYIGTAGGGIWKSKDGGVRYEPIFDDHAHSIGCLTIDQSNPETVWVGTGEINTRNSVSYGNGLYKTEDGGKTWKHMGFKDSERIAEIRVHPKDSDTVYVAVLGHLWGDHEERGLYKTTDGGENWERLLYVDETTGAIDVDLDPQEPDTVYAAMWQFRRWPYFFESGGPGSGLYKSTDGGKNFEKLSNGLPEGNLGRIDLDIAPSRPSRIYAVVEADVTGLYRSDNLGESWEKVSSAFNIQARPFYLSTIKVDPQDYNRVYNPSFILSVSEDGGETWPSLMGGGFGGGVHPDHQAIWINPHNPKHVIIGTDGGVYTSHNGSGSFLYTANLPVSTFYRVAVDNQIPYHIYGGLQDNGSWSAPSKAPGGVSNKHWDNAGGGDGFCVWPDGEDPNFVYWEMQGGVLSRLDKTTEENKNITPFPEKGMEKNRFNWNSPLMRSPTNPKTLYFGSQYLYRSKDRGDSWTRISPDLTTDDPEKQRQEESGGLTPDATTAENHCTIFTVAESSLDENIIWAGTDDGNLQVTKDGGANWENVVGNIPDLPPNTWCSYVKTSDHEKGVAYATFDGHRSGDKTTYVFKTTDFGQSWKSLVTEEIEGHAHVIWQDRVNSSLLFLGTEEGLFISFDDGGQWMHFRNELPVTPVRDLTVQEREADLVVATHGRGIYIIDDISPLRSLKPEILNEKVALLDSRPGRAEKGRQVMAMHGDGVFTAQPAPSGVQITYYLKRRHLIGDLKLEIYNEEGELIKTVLGDKRKGINRVNWNMRLAPPRVARASGLNFGAFFGPYVKTGKYKVKLIKGKDTIETEVELLPPLNSPHSDEDRNIQYDAVMKLYDMQSEVSFATDQLQDLISQVEDRLEKAKKGSLNKKLNEMLEKLNASRGVLVAENAGIFVTRERLRDDIINLYAAVSEYSGHPGESSLQRLEDLQKSLAEWIESAKPHLELAAINKNLSSKKLEPLKLLDRETWNDPEFASKTSGGKASKKTYRAFRNYLAPWLHRVTPF